MIKKNYIVKLDNKLTIKDILYIIQNSSKQIVYLTDKNGNLLGSINDGDIRRSLLRGFNLNSKIQSIYFKRTAYLNKELKNNEIVKILKKKKISSIPILKNKKIIKVVFLKDLIKNTTNSATKNYDVIIMAGGYGKRLLPLTKNTPKCLININKKKKIIDYVIENLGKYNLKTLHFMTYYKSEKIVNYVSKKYKTKFNLYFHKEKKPMGTAGGLRELVKNKNLSENFILINSDILTKIDFSSLILFYQKNKSIFTVVTKKINQKLSFGSITNKSEVLDTIEEKPTISFFINAGIYLFSKKLLRLIPKNSKDYKMTDLIKKIKGKRKKIKIFHSYEDWHDVGSHEKLKEMRKRLKSD